MVRQSAAILFLFSGIMAFAVMAPSQPSRAEELPVSVQNSSRAVVRVLSYDWRGRLINEGLGIILNQAGDLVTTIPTMNGAYFSEAVFSEGETRIIEYIRTVDEASGLLIASLEEPDKTLPMLSEMASFPEPGTEVWVFSGKVPARLSITAAVVEEVREIPGAQGFRFVRTSGARGGAGSPILGRRGDVTGIVLIPLPDSEGGCVVVSSSFLADAPRTRGTVPVLQDKWAEEESANWCDTQRGVYLEGLGHLWSGDYQVAVSLLEKASSENGQMCGYASLALGNCLLAMEDPAGAEKAFRMAMGALPESIETMVGLSKAFLAQGKIEGARRLSEEMTLSWPDDSRTNSMLARVLDATGASAGAFELAKRAVEVNPACPEANDAFGDLLISRGLFEEAASCFDRLSTTVCLEKGAMEDLCYANLRCGNLERAVEFCTAAARDKPEALLYLGEAYRAMGFRDQARVSLKRCLEAFPDSVTVICRLGDLLAEMGRNRESVELFEGAVAGQPRSAWLRFKLGEAFYLAGKMGRAAGQLETLRELNPRLAEQLAIRMGEGN